MFFDDFGRKYSYVSVLNNIYHITDWLGQVVQRMEIAIH